MVKIASILIVCALLMYGLCVFTVAQCVNRIKVELADEALLLDFRTSYGQAGWDLLTQSMSKRQSAEFELVRTNQEHMLVRFLPRDYSPIVSFRDAERFAQRAGEVLHADTYGVYDVILFKNIQHDKLRALLYVGLLATAWVALCALVALWSALARRMGRHMHQVYAGTCVRRHRARIVAMVAATALVFVLFVYIASIPVNPHLPVVGDHLFEKLERMIYAGHLLPRNAAFLKYDSIEHTATLFFAIGAVSAGVVSCLCLLMTCIKPRGEVYERKSSTSQR